jgi:acetyl-CoA carboxylase carboxyl transferase subunit alpha
MKPNPLDFEKPIVRLEKQLEELKKHSKLQAIDLEREVRSAEEKIEQTRREIYAGLTAWQRVQIARHNARPFAADYLERTFSDFVELHGDRLFGDDRAIPCGLARLEEFRCVVLAQQKGRDTKENIQRNFGMSLPEGYRKALRVMRLGEKFSLPIIGLIDTPGAYPGLGGEERHVAEAIAVNLREMMRLRTPIIAIVIGEGGSGGALGIGVADRILMLENAYYSVISPEGCAAILWKHRSHAPEAAEALKLTAHDLKQLELIDEVVPEPLGGAQYDHDLAAANVKMALVSHLRDLANRPIDELLEDRYQKYRRMGRVLEDSSSNS